MSGNTLEKIRSDILDDLSSWLHGCYQGSPTGPQGEPQLRFGAALYVLVRLHRIDARGRCRLCRAGHPRRHRMIHWPARKAPCRVLKIAAFFATASEEEFWLRILPSLGIRCELGTIRAHLMRRVPAEHPGGADALPTQVDHHGRHALVDPEAR
jgi:hypothetical protein